MRVDDSIMKKLLRILLKTFTVILISILSIVALFFLVRFIGQQVNKITPEGGINESVFMDRIRIIRFYCIYTEDLDHLQVHMIMLLQDNGRMNIRSLHGIREIVAKAIQKIRTIQNLHMI